MSAETTLYDVRADNGLGGIVIGRDAADALVTTLGARPDVLTVVATPLPAEPQCVEFELTMLAVDIPTDRRRWNGGPMPSPQASDALNAAVDAFREAVEAAGLLVAHNGYGVRPVASDPPMMDARWLRRSRSFGHGEQL